MRSLWAHWPKLKEKLEDVDFITLCDYDGTLAPIAARPWMARLPDQTRTALKILSNKSRVTVGIVSGRPLYEVKRLVGIRGIAYIGSHGFEICLPGQKPQLRLPAGFSENLRCLVRDLRQSLRGLRGPWIRRKIAGVAVHYRQADALTASQALERLADIARRHNRHFRTQQGKMVLEFVPFGSITKGSAVRELVRKLHAGRGSIVVYFGDDLTDESVFSTLRKRDLGILVGERRTSGARYYLRSPSAVAKLLQRLGKITA
jgi:trehalose-phosphatase